jgi:hypothetical protein
LNTSKEKETRKASFKPAQKLLKTTSRSVIHSQKIVKNKSRIFGTKSVRGNKIGIVDLDSEFTSEKENSFEM